MVTVTAGVIVARSAPRRPGRARGGGGGGGVGAGDADGTPAERPQLSATGSRRQPPHGHQVCSRIRALQNRARRRAPAPAAGGCADRGQKPGLRPRLVQRPGEGLAAEGDQRPHGTADDRVGGRRPRGKARLGVAWEGSAAASSKCEGRVGGRRPRWKGAWEGDDRAAAARGLQLCFPARSRWHRNGR